MDLASVIGLLLALGLMLFGMMNSPQGVAGVANFIDVPSVLITLGGSLGATLACNTMSGFIGGLKSFGLILKVPPNDEIGAIKSIIDLSNVARKEGLLALEESGNSIEDAFMKKGIMLIVDGTDPELVRSILETELVNIDVRHQGNIAFWKGLGANGPAWGMIGTLIGLVLMLVDMSDAASIGPNMAVALITTFYGSVLANWICTPVSSKLDVQNASEMMTKEIMIEGLLSIQAGENPRVIEEKLKSFLAPSAREGLGGEGGGE